MPTDKPTEFILRPSEKARIEHPELDGIIEDAPLRTPKSPEPRSDSE